MLHACVMDFGGQWEQYLDLVEFAYNNSYHSGIKMIPFKALYGRYYLYPVSWFETSKVRPHGADFLREVLYRVWVIQDRL